MHTKSLRYCFCGTDIFFTSRLLCFSCDGWSSLYPSVGVICCTPLCSRIDGMCCRPFVEILPNPRTAPSVYRRHFVRPTRASEQKFRGSIVIQSDTAPRHFSSICSAGNSLEDIFALRNRTYSIKKRLRRGGVVTWGVHKEKYPEACQQNIADSYSDLWSTLCRRK